MTGSASAILVIRLTTSLLSQSAFESDPSGGIINLMADQDEPEGSEALRDEAYDDMRAEQFEELERHTENESRIASFFRFAALTSTLVGAGLGASTSALEAGNVELSNIPWGELLVAAGVVAGVVVGLAALSSRVAQLRDRLRRSGKDEDRPVAANATATRQVIQLHNQLVEQQLALHRTLRRPRAWQ